MLYKVAIVGCGRMAGYIDDEVAHYDAIKVPYSHAAAYHAYPGTRIIAACALHESSVERFCTRWDVPNGYTDYTEMIRTEKPDIVSVTTHAELHAPVTIFAAEHGAQAVFCEKPIATSLDEADAMIAACKANGTVLLIGHLRRYHSAFRNAVSYISSGALGALKEIHTIHTGKLFHTGSHSFDLISMFADAPVAFVQASLDEPVEDISAEKIDHDVSGVGIIRFSNDVTAFVHARGTKPPLFDQRFICEQGELAVYNNGTEWDLQVIEPVIRKQPDGLKAWKDLPPISKSVRTALPFPIEVNSMTLSAVEELVRAIDTDGNEAISSTGEMGRLALELGFGFIQSHKAGGKRVALPLRHRTQHITAR